MKHRLIKILTISLTATLLWPLVKFAYAYFDDFENASSVLVATDTLTLNLEEENNCTEPLFPGQSCSKVLSVSPETAVPTQYLVHSGDLAGPLCDYIQLVANTEGGEPEYQGPLLSFITAPAPLPNTAIWTFDLFLVSDDPALQGATCTFKLAFAGWQTIIPQFGTGGFSDLASVINTITAGTTQGCNNVGPEQAPSIVINEIMWMGSTVAPDDLWLELRNTTDQPIDIGLWTLENATPADKYGVRRYQFLPTTIIPPAGLFVISRYHNDSPFSALREKPDLQLGKLSFEKISNDPVRLLNQNGEIIDQAKGDTWPAGIDETEKHSMQRWYPAGDGLLWTNWASCLDETCKNILYWDSEDGNFGTPGTGNAFGQGFLGCGNITIISTDAQNSQSSAPATPEDPPLLENTLIDSFDTADDETDDSTSGSTATFDITQDPPPIDPPILNPVTEEQTSVESTGVELPTEPSI